VELGEQRRAFAAEDCLGPNRSGGVEWRQEDCQEVYMTDMANVKHFCGARETLSKAQRERERDREERERQRHTSIGQIPFENNEQQVS